MRFFVILSIILIKSSWAVCFISCNTTKCAHLEYYLKKCQKCKKIGTKCRKAFCDNHSQWCENNVPVKNISVSNPDNMGNGGVDVCLSRLFAPFTFQENDNGALSINNLNMVNITFFEQTKGEAKKRNIGTMSNIIANYLLYSQPELRKLPEKLLKNEVRQWVQNTFRMSLERADNFHYHRMVEHIRRDLYKRKGIPTQTVIEQYKGHKYPITTSKMGCATEMAFSH